jgi:hypothetical protein
MISAPDPTVCAGGRRRSRLHRPGGHRQRPATGRATWHIERGPLALLAFRARRSLSSTMAPRDRTPQRVYPGELTGPSRPVLRGHRCVSVRRGRDLGGRGGPRVAQVAARRPRGAGLGRTRPSPRPRRSGSRLTRTRPPATRGLSSARMTASSSRDRASFWPRGRLLEARGGALVARDPPRALRSGVLADRPRRPRPRRRRRLPRLTEQPREILRSF